MVTLRVLSQSETRQYRFPISDRRATAIGELLEPLRFQPDHLYLYRGEYHLEHHFNWDEEVPGEVVAQRITEILRGARIVEVSDLYRPGRWRKINLRFALS